MIHSFHKKELETVVINESASASWIVSAIAWRADGICKPCGKASCRGAPAIQLFPTISPEADSWLGLGLRPTKHVGHSSGAHPAQTQWCMQRQRQQVILTLSRKTSIFWHGSQGTLVKKSQIERFAFNFTRRRPSRWVRKTICRCARAQPI
jgi:hypothetical protein